VGGEIAQYYELNFPKNSMTDTPPTSTFFPSILLDSTNSDGLDLKETGNHFFKRSDYPSAINAYNEAIKLLSVSPIIQSNPDFKAGLMSSYLNLSLVYIKGNQYKLAIQNSDLAVKVDSDSVKAYYRRGQAKAGLKLYSEAISDFQTILDREPSNKEAKSALNVAISDMKVKLEQDKGGVLAKMFCGGLYDEEIKNTPVSKNNKDPWEQMKQRTQWNQEIKEKFPDVEINKNGPTILPMHTKSTKIHPFQPKKISP
jgi:tetratricopeptide (TPR) repeat protein